VQAVCELDQDDSNIFRHCQNHFTKVLGLRFRFAVKLHFHEFGHALDQAQNLRTKVFSEFKWGNVGIF
jgi:hypothetical protein